ncbi:MAG: phospholipid carrier-dependent glycosyltransferase, partial [Thermoproteota archaeon]|nr:phospholipid carrier-dependent glycosyltransferase [Thermoproteota archaeon]
MIGKLNYNYLLLLFIPLILSAFTRLWNPLGFPVGPSNDESIYIRRAAYVLNGFGPQESLTHDHPYFLQLFLAGILWLIGYPNSLNLSVGSTLSVEMLYMMPRIIIGILAILDTFLIFRIAERYYSNKAVAFIASLIFAVMPITLLTRRVLLESVQLPFILTSILFAVYVNEKIKEGYGNNNGKINVLILTLLSGMSLGLAIFTKLPAFVFIPLVMYLMLSNTKIKRNVKLALAWLFPVILVPSIWPIYAIYLNQFNAWIKGI